MYNVHTSTDFLQNYIRNAHCILPDFFFTTLTMHFQECFLGKIYQLCSHCAFSSNLFHGYLAQILINQLSDPENKKCSPWKVFGKNHPQILLLLSRRGPRSPEARLSQHYIGPKMTFQHFSNFCRKKFPGLTKRLLHNFIQF